MLEGADPGDHELLHRLLVPAAAVDRSVPHPHLHQLEPVQPTHHVPAADTVPRYLESAQLSEVADSW